MIEAGIHPGSPPHARGRRDSFLKIHLNTGITPACAGKTTLVLVLTAAAKDHPRMRGEDFGTFCIQFQDGGSPPHARGRHPGRCAVSYVFRITPACAGKTKAFGPAPRCGADHPRMRGEDERSNPDYLDTIGSPPHARGRPALNSIPGPIHGITPACAGKTFGIT